MCLKKLILLLITLCLSYTYIYSQTPYPFPGFPVNIDHQRRPTLKPGVPIITDLDNDGNKEIIAVGYDYMNVSPIPFMLHVIKTDGHEMEGFPKAYFQQIYDIAAGDINKDGYIDIVLRLKDSIDVIDKTGNHLPSFPVFYRTLQSQSNWVPTNFINLYDLDNDGNLEIITGQYGAMAVFDNHGHFKPGWPRAVVGRVRSNPAIGDLDNNGKAEIISTQFIELNYNIDSPSINILRYDGKEFNNNWPKYYDSLYYTYTSSPSIYVGATANQSYIIFAIQKDAINPFYSILKYFKYNINGEPLDSINLSYPVAGFNEETMVIGDVNKDGVPEYSMSELADIYLFSPDFTVLSGWPNWGSQGSFLTPALVKLTYGSELNVLTPGSYANDTGGFVYAYDKSGASLSWSPLRPIGINFGMCVTDLNNDGSVEIITTNAKQDTSFYINIWTVPGIAFNHSDFPWPEYCHDRYKSNQYGFIPPDEPNGIQPMSNNVPKEFLLYQNYPNPFNPSTAIKYTVKSTALINLSVYDVLGRKVSEIVNENQKPGIYSVSFNGYELSSGVYYYRLTADGAVIDTKKMILIK